MQTLDYFAVHVPFAFNNGNFLTHAESTRCRRSNKNIINQKLECCVMNIDLERNVGGSTNSTMRLRL
jgi:hypothetical protein